MVSSAQGVSSPSDLDNTAVDDPILGTYNYRALNNMMGNGAINFANPETNMGSLSGRFNNPALGYGDISSNISPRDPSSNLDLESINIEGDNRIHPQLGEQTELSSVLQPNNPVAKSTDPLAQIAQQGQDDSALAIKRNNQIEGARAGAAILRATGGIINANSRYTQIANQNNFNIHLAEIQALNVASDSANRQLRETEKGKSRGDQARLSAVAQGQSATGDLANTAASNEDVYAAQNAMNMQINSMRTIFGIQSQQRQMESSNVSAGLNRDAEIAQAVLQGANQIGQSYLGTVKGSKIDTTLAGPPIADGETY